MEGAGGVEEEGTSAGQAHTFLAPLKLTVRSSTFCGSKTTRDFDDANSQVFFMDNSSELQEIQEIQVTSTS